MNSTKSIKLSSSLVFSTENLFCMKKHHDIHQTPYKCLTFLFFDVQGLNLTREYICDSTYLFYCFLYCSRGLRALLPLRALSSLLGKVIYSSAVPPLWFQGCLSSWLVFQVLGSLLWSSLMPKDASWSWWFYPSENSSSSHLVPPALMTFCLWVRICLCVVVV